MNVTVKEMPIEEAKKLGAMALFGEKYGKVVRVVDIEGWSTEFCGGTPVKNTAQILSLIHIQMCIRDSWLEELFILPEYQGNGFGSEAIHQLEEIVKQYPSCVIQLP